MTVENQTKAVPINGNDSATIHSFSPMVITQASDMVVTHVDSSGAETTLSQGTGGSAYAVIVSSFPGTGSIRYPEDEITPLPTGESLVMKRVLTLEQQTDLTPQGPYAADTQEQQLDKLLMIDLQQQESVDRAIKLPIGFTGTIGETDTPVAERYLRRNAANDGYDHSALSQASASASDVAALDVSTSAAAAGGNADFAREDHVHFLPRAHMPKGGDLTSASPLVIDTDGNYFDVAGTTGFTAMTVVADLLFMLQFDGILLLTHHATTLNLPGGSDIKTAAGDRMLCYSTDANAVHVLAYMRADGVPKGGDLTSADPLVVDTDGEYFDVAGTTGFAAMTVAAGRVFMLQFDGILTLTHHATNLNLPGGANITTTAGDRMLCYSTGANTVHVISYFRADGTAPAADLEFVSTAALTTATSVVVTGMAAGYDYIIQLEAFAPTDDAESIYMRFSDDAGSNYEADATDYGWGAQSAGAGVFDASDSEIAFAGTVLNGNDAGNHSSLVVTLVNPNASDENTTAYWYGMVMDDSATPAPVAIQGGGHFLQGTDAVAAVQFLWSGGSTFKAQGDITVWRRKRS